jgi:ribonuclease P protein component
VSRLTGHYGFYCSNPVNLDTFNYNVTRKIKWKELISLQSWREKECVVSALVWQLRVVVNLSLEEDLKVALSSHKPNLASWKVTQPSQNSNKKSLLTLSSDLGFSKSHRLVKGHEFRYMRENAESIRGKSIILCYAPAPDSQRRLGIVVSKRFHKHAVKRNRAKRIIREAYRHLQDKLPNNWFVIISRAHLSGKSSIDVQEELLKLIEKSNLVWRKKI